MEAMDHEDFFGEADELNGYDNKGSLSVQGSGHEGPVTPGSPDSLPGTPDSGRSTESGDSEEVDTDVHLSNESVRVMAETSGVQLDEEACSAIAESVISKLRHVTLLAMQFSRHGHSVGLRVTDFTKAEKMLDTSYSIGYGYSHNFPEYLDFGGFCTEFEGTDIDVAKIISSPSINEVVVDESKDPVLVSRFINYHDKLSKDYDEGRLRPDFYNLLSESNFGQCCAEDWDYRQNCDTVYSNGMVNGHSQGEQSPQILPDYVESVNTFATQYSSNFGDTVERELSHSELSGVAISSGNQMSKRIKVEKNEHTAEPMEIDDKCGASLKLKNLSEKSPSKGETRNRTALLAQPIDIYKSSKFLSNPTELGDQIFSPEDPVEEEATPCVASETPKLESASTKKYPTRAVSPDITETRSSKKFIHSSTPDSVTAAAKKETNKKSVAGKSSAESSSFSSDESDSSSEESLTDEYNSNDIDDDDFEVVIDPEPEPVEPELSDTDGEELSDDEEENDLLLSNEDLPLEWATYLRHFMVIFHDREKRYETFEKVSYSYYLDDEEDEELPALTDFDIILKDVAQNGVLPVFQIIVEFFHNYVGGKYLHIGNKQLRRIIAFAEVTIASSVPPKLCHIKPLMAILLDMLTLPVPCKLQQGTSTSILQIADSCQHPFNLELIRWITLFISSMLQRGSKCSAQQLTPTVKSRICGAIYLALGLNERGIRPQLTHQWMKNVFRISENHYVVHQKAADDANQKIVLCDAADSYLEEAIMKFIRTYTVTFWKTHPDGHLKPMLDRALENYGEKLNLIFSKPEYMYTTPRRRQEKIRPSQRKLERLEITNNSVIVNEFLVRRGIINTQKQTKIQIPFAMCVL